MEAAQDAAVQSVVDLAGSDVESGTQASTENGSITTPANTDSPGRSIDAAQTDAPGSDASPADLIDDASIISEFKQVLDAIRSPQPQQPAPQAKPPAEGQAQPQAQTPKGFDKLIQNIRDYNGDEAADEVKALVSLVQQQAEKLDQVHSDYQSRQQQTQQQVVQSVHSFFDGLAKNGHPEYGESFDAARNSPEALKLRSEVYDNAAAIQAVFAKSGRRLSNEDALKKAHAMSVLERTGKAPANQTATQMRSRLVERSKARTVPPGRQAVSPSQQSESSALDFISQGLRELKTGAV